MSLDNVQIIVLVLSGKGGVGKSSVTTQLALSLCLQGKSVGVLDVDLTGPSIPRMLGIEAAKVRQAPGGWLPVTVHEAVVGHAVHESQSQSHSEPESPSPSKSDSQSQSTSQAQSLASESQKSEARIGSLQAMSLGFLLADRGDAVVWRGPKKTAMVRQFLSDVLWPAGLEYLLIDTPPGTSDEHISLVETLLGKARPGQVAGAVVVTTPQAISVADVRKELNFCRKTSVRVLGVVENMSGFVCENCSECTDIFGQGGGRQMAEDFQVPFLGSVPMDAQFINLVETGQRPRYPAGTTVLGEDMSTREPRAGEGSTEATGERKNMGDKTDPKEDTTSDVDTETRLVVKYKDCSLSPIFREITKQVLAKIHGAT